MRREGQYVFPSSDTRWNQEKQKKMGGGMGRNLTYFIQKNISQKLGKKKLGLMNF